MRVDLTPGASVALGVLVGLVSTSIQSVGLTLQRKSHLLEEEKEEQYGYERRPPYRRRRWQIGMFMFLVANIVGSTIQITTLPLPVLSTLQASGLVFNTACATIILSEPFTRWSIIGTVLVAGGAVLIAAFGALAEPSHSLDQLLMLLGRSQFLVWLLGTFVLVAIMMVCVWLLSRLHPRPTMRVRLIKGMLYGAMSGILSAHCLLLAKSAVELLVRTIADKSNQFNRWQSWMILVFFVLLALSQLYYLHRGLRLCSTSVLYPFVFCIYNIIAILDGLIYFHQTNRLSVTHACLIALGTVILLAGVFALSWRLSDEPHRGGSHGRSAEDAKSMVHRVPTPQSALAPGLGLVDADTPFDPDASASDEEALPRHRPSEVTPLLRTSTAPTWAPTQGMRRQKRPSNLRRLTLRQEQSEIWDELNDRPDRPVRFDTGVYNGSPRATPRRATMPARRPRSASLQLPRALRSLRWRTPGAPLRPGGAARAVSDDAVAAAPSTGQVSDDGDDTDVDVDAGPDRSFISEARGRGRWSGWTFGGQQGAEPDAPGGWFKLRWWKRRWRERSQDARPGDGEAGE